MSKIILQVLRVPLLYVLVSSWVSMSAQITTREDLARLLTTQTGRQTVASYIVESKKDRVPLLLDLSRASIGGVDQHEMNVGLADVFGQLRITDAIPFLLRNISMRRNPMVDLKPWLKTTKAIELEFPAVSALIAIGPDASREVIKAYQKALTPDERLAAIFVVSRIREVPEARTFLRDVAFEAGLERSFAEEGLNSAK